MWAKSESWEEDQIGDMPPLEYIEDDGVFVISCAGGDDGERMPPPLGRVEIKGLKTNVLINTAATVNIMDMPMLQKLTTRAVISPTKCQI